MEKTVKVFVSYEHEIESQTQIVDTLGKLCQARGIELIRDVNTLTHGDSLIEFMDVLSKGENIIIIISKPYFESEYCMYELLNIFREKNVRERTQVLIADDCKFDDAKFQARLIKLWHKKWTKTQEQIKDLPQGTATNLQKRANNYRDFSQNIEGFITFLSDRMTTDLAALKNHNYSQLLDKFSPSKSADILSDEAKPSPDSDYLINVVEFRQELLNEVVKTFSLATDLQQAFIKQHRLPPETTAAQLGEKLLGQLEQQKVKIFSNLRIVLRDILSGYEHKQDFKAAHDLINHAEHLLHTLSLLAISLSDAERLQDGVFKQSAGIKTLGQTTYLSAEVATAHGLQSYPQYMTKSAKIVGKHATRFEPGEELEPGIKANIVDCIGKKLWPKVFPIETLDSYDLNRLRRQIKSELTADDRLKKNYYLVVSICPEDTSNSPLKCPETREELLLAIPELPIIVLNNSQHSATYLASDEDLEAEIYRFYEIVNTFNGKHPSANPDQ
ncbi:MAG: toll/interleukin-1 receptor domain-containing protein [Methylococcales bacterium]|nr:toll/interleukin-1 receptor domain-containing protein [Methylococcales bacterium]